MTTNRAINHSKILACTMATLMGVGGCKSPVSQLTEPVSTNSVTPGISLPPQDHAERVAPIVVATTGPSTTLEGESPEGSIEYSYSDGAFGQKTFVVEPDDSEGTISRPPPAGFHFCGGVGNVYRVMLTPDQISNQDLGFTKNGQLVWCRDLNISSPPPSSPTPSSPPTPAPTPRPTSSPTPGPKPTLPSGANPGLKPLGQGICWFRAQRHISPAKGPARIDVVATPDIGPWELSVVGQSGTILRGQGNALNKKWNGVLPGQTEPLPDGKYSLRLTAAGIVRSADIIIDSQSPEISDIKMETDPSDPSGNTLIVSGKVEDVGPAGLDLNKIKIEIKGTTVKDTDHPFHPKTGAFSRRFTIDPKAGEVITAEVTAVDKAGNQAVKDSNSDELQELAKLRTQVETIQLAMNDRLMASCSINSSAYRLKSYGNEVSFVELRDAEAYAAALVAYDEDISATDRAAAFIYYATLINVPMSSDEVLLMVAGYGAGKLIVKGGVVIFRSTKEMLPSLSGKICAIIADNVDGVPFRWYGPTIGKFDVEKFVKGKHIAGGKITDDECKGITYLLLRGENIFSLRRLAKGPTPDFILNGIRTELKTISNLTGKNPANAIKKTILRGASQDSKQVIVDLRESPQITLEFFEKLVVNRVWGDRPGLQQIRFIGLGPKKINGTHSDTVDIVFPRP